MKDESNEFIVLGRDHIICEICSRSYSQETFYEHLFEHSLEEVEVLKKLSERTKDMTPEQYEDFLVKLDFESFKRLRQSSK